MTIAPDVMQVETASRQREAPTPAPEKPRRRRRTSLAARGEAWVWLTGGALATAVMLILGLLVLIVIQGATTFWPGPVFRIELADGSVIMGEEFRDEWYAPAEDLLEQLPPEQAAVAEAQMKAHDGKIHRRLIRTANFDLTNTHFTWVNEYEIADGGEDLPDWAIVIERLAWGRFYGTPKAFELEGQIVAEGAEPTWALFREHHAGVRELFEQRKDLEKYEIGKVNRKLEQARLTLREAELEHEPPVLWVTAWRTLNQFTSAGASDDPQIIQAIEDARADLAFAEREVDKPSQAFLDAVETFEQAQAEGQEAYERITDQIAELNEQMDRYQMLMATVDGQEKKLALSEIVRAYPANQLATGEKWSVYASRWGEFLTDDPREANSEGGVFPAIFGTVAMTMIMSLVVVPFGVLAALYLREYAKAGPIVSAVRIAVNNLAGVPSIVFGVFGLGFFCYGVGAFIDGGPDKLSIAPWPPVRWFVALGVLAVIAVGAFFASVVSMRPRRPGESALLRRWLGRGAAVLWIAATVAIVLLIVKSPHFDGFNRAKLPSPTLGAGGLLWASLTLALLTLPVVIVATEEALAAVPGSMREGSYACGASKWQTIKRIVLPRAMPGIMTGAILAMARGAGEVAPLMLVGAVKLAPELPVDSVYPYVHAERSFMHLGFHIYDLGFQSQNSEAAKPMVFTTTLLLILIIATLNLTAIWLRSRLRRKFTANQF